MIDPELAAIIDLLPQMDLVDPGHRPRQAFDDMIAAIKIEIPGVETPRDRGSDGAGLRGQP